MPGLNVLVIDPGGVLRRMCSSIRRSGYLVTPAPGDAQGALALAAHLRPDLVLLPADHPEAPDLSARLAQHRLAPVVWAIDDASQDTVERAKRARVAAVVRAAAGVFEMQAAMELAVLSFRTQRQLEKTVAKLEETLAGRKAVEQAKGLLMERFGLKEAEAYARLRQMAMDSRKPIREVAETILALADLTEPRHD